MQRNVEFTRVHKTIQTGRRGNGEIYRFALSPYLYVILRLLLPLTLCSLLLTLDRITPLSEASDIPLQEDSESRISRVSAKAKLSFGYDNNVSESIEDRIESRFLQLYVSSGMYMLPAQRTLLSLKLQNGLKYLNAPSLSGESVLINGLNLYLSYKLLERLKPEIQGEIRGRTSIHNESGVLPSEEAYLRGSIGAALRAVVFSDMTGSAFYHYKFTNFEDFDPFDRRGPQMGLKADVRLLPNSTVSLQYSREQTRFHKWDLVSLDEKSSRLDTLDDVSICLQIYKYLLFDITYSHQNGRSDIERYSYRADKLALLTAKSLPQGIMLQLYALIRSKKFSSSSEEPVLAQLELEDDERRMLTVKLSKDIRKDCALEAQYDLRRGSSYRESGPYTKGVFSFSLSFHF